MCVRGGGGVWTVGKYLFGTFKTVPSGEFLLTADRTQDVGQQKVGTVLAD
jgi:hypothetical protein